MVIMVAIDSKSVDESYGCPPSLENRCLVKTDVGNSLSTFGAIDDKSKVGNLYLTFSSGRIYSGNLGGNADSFRPILFSGGERFFLCLETNILMLHYFSLFAISMNKRKNR